MAFVYDGEAMIEIEGNLYSLWMENADGVRFVPDLTGDYPADQKPEGFVYSHVEFPFMVRHDVSRVADPKEVALCAHPSESVQPTGGWIDGVEGRKCGKCLGTQTRDASGPWPKEWRAGSSTHLCTGEGSFSSSLVLAMTRPTEAEQKLAINRALEHPAVTPRAPEDRGTVCFVSDEYAAKTGAKLGDRVTAYGPGPKLYSLSDAILVAVRACEGCLNVLLWEYGCADGYPFGSDKHQKVGTSCLFCRPIPTQRQMPAAQPGAN